MRAMMGLRRLQKRWTVALGASGAGAVAAVAVAGTMHGWDLADSPTSAAAWCTAPVLAVALAVALRRKGRHEGWFHPLSLPLAAVAIMSLAAPLWVQATHERAGLLYSPGYVPAGAPLAASLSAVACAALVLVVVGYLAGAVTALAVTRPAPPAVGPAFRCRDMRWAGFALLCAGSLSQALVTHLGAGTPYGADQLQYGVASLLADGATTAVLAGLVIVNAAGAHTARVTRLRDLLRSREWVALALYMLAVATSGQRAGLIAPAVYVAWAYSTQVRAIRLRWAVAGVAVALAGAAVIAGYRSGEGLSPGSPAAIMRSAAGDVSSPAWLTQQTVMYVPSGTPYLHGSTYLAAAEAQLPGPVSRETGATSRTASAVFRDITGFWDPNQGFAESYPSEAYLNFGLPGCLCAGLFLGVLMGWAWRKHGETAARPRDLLYPVLLAGLVYGFRSDALTQVKDVLYPMLAVWAGMAWYRLPLAPRTGPPTVRASSPAMIAAVRATGKGVSWASIAQHSPAYPLPGASGHHTSASGT
jgi:hypothetical protein